MITINHRLGYITTVVLLLGLFSCKQNLNSAKEEADGPIIVSVFGHNLTKQMLDASITQGLNTKDSTEAAKAYIQLWIKDELMFEKAKKNLNDIDQINDLVERYRQSLTIFTYQEQLLKEVLAKKISDSDLKTYYDAHLDQFKLDNNIVKTLYLKIPVTSPELENFKKWYLLKDPTFIEKIEKASIQNTVAYDYSGKWTNFVDVMDNIPYPIESGETFLKTNKTLEVKDSSYVYLLNIRDFRLAGTQAPFEYAKGRVLDIVLNQKRAAFLLQIEKDLYDKSLKNNDIKFYNNTSLEPSPNKG